MATELFPKKVRSWLKAKIINRISDIRSPVAKHKYFPYKYGYGSFLIAKSPEDKYNTCSFGLPIPPRRLWLNYGTTEEEYLSSGKQHVGKMLEIVKDSSFSFTKGNRILDFGCGGGRMLRHLRNMSDSCEIWGVEISAEFIYWCKQYLSPPFYFATTTTIPHLPFEDRYFNFIYCGSVFTHIDDLAEAWLLELRRILAPEGVLYLTIHDNHTLELFNGSYKNHWLAKRVKNHELYNQLTSDFEMLAIGRGVYSQIFYNIDYFRKTLNQIYHILSVTEEAYGYQTAILVKRK